MQPTKTSPRKYRNVLKNRSQEFKKSITKPVWLTNSALILPSAKKKDKL